MNGHVGDMARERLAEIEAEGLALQDSLTGYTQQLEIFEIKQTKIRRDAAAKNKEDKAKDNKEEVDIEKERQAEESMRFWKNNNENKIASNLKYRKQNRKKYNNRSKCY